MNIQKNAADDIKLTFRLRVAQRALINLKFGKVCLNQFGDMLFALETIRPSRANSVRQRSVVFTPYKVGIGKMSSC